MLTGSGDDVDRWFDLLRSKFFTLNIHGDLMRLECISSKLKDHAYSTYDAFMKGKQPLRWDFETLMNAKFRPVGFQSPLRTDLRALTQSATISAYSTAFLKLSSRIEDMTMVDLIYQYRWGLKETYRRELAKHCFKDIHEVITVATNLELSDFSCKSSASSMLLVEQDSSRNQVTCNFCKKEGTYCKVVLL